MNQATIAQPKFIFSSTWNIYFIIDYFFFGYDISFFLIIGQFCTFYIDLYTGFLEFIPRVNKALLSPGVICIVSAKTGFEKVCPSSRVKCQVRIPAANGRRKMAAY